MVGQVAANIRKIRKPEPYKGKGVRYAGEHVTARPARPPSKRHEVHDISSTKDKQLGRTRRHHRVRKKVSGTAARPRLAVFRSNKHITAQVIDDRAGRTLAAASTVEAGPAPGPARHGQQGRGRPRSAVWWPSGPRRPV